VLRTGAIQSTFASLDAHRWSGIKKPARPGLPNVLSMASKTKTQSDSGFSAEDIAAMKQRAAELRAEKGGAKKADEADRCLDAIAAMDGDDRRLAERIHAIVLKAAPHLDVTTWYGFPSYKKDGKVICFFKPAAKFKDRYATLGFETTAALDDGTVWPVAFAITDLTAADEKMLAALVKKAAG
jgi:uncharacterized protein YdhG (YjbR/CyaY superfamily)